MIRKYKNFGNMIFGVGGILILLSLIYGVYSKNPDPLWFGIGGFLGIGAIFLGVIINPPKIFPIGGK